MRSIKKIEKMTPGNALYNVKDKAYNHVMMRVMQACDEADEIRSKVTTKEALHKWQSDARSTFLESMGDFPYDGKTALNARITGKIEEPGLTIEKVIFESREHVYVTANLYIPEEREKKCPAVLLQSGHSDEGKAAEAYQRAARMIAGTGIIVMVTDPPGQGERSNYMEEGCDIPQVQRACADHQQFGNQCFLTGASPIKYFLADGMRAVDYLCSRSEVDPERIGATGNSGGGTLTALIMLVDERIKAAAPGCWPCSTREYFVTGTSPDSEQIWPDTLKNHLDFYEIMAGMCPKPLLILAAEEDFLPIEGTEKLYEECRRLWKIHGCEDKVALHIGPGKHGFSESNAKAAAEFFGKYLCGHFTREESEYLKSFCAHTLSEKELACTKSGQITTEYKDSLTVHEQNLREYKRKYTEELSPEVKKKLLEERVYYARKPIKNFHIRTLHKIFENGLCAEMLLWFSQEMMPCYGVKFQAMNCMKKNIPVTICLWQGGTDCLSLQMDIIRRICKEGRCVLVVDLTAMGKCTPNLPLMLTDPCESVSSVTDKISKTLIRLGDSLCAMRAFDLMQTIRMLRVKFGTEDIEIYAEGKYAVFARIAEVLDKEVAVRTVDEITVSELVTEKYYNTYDIAQVIMPGLAKYLD